MVVHEKKDFEERSKILLATDLKNNFGILKMRSNEYTTKNFDILATNLSVLRNYL